MKSSYMKQVHKVYDASTVLLHVNRIISSSLELEKVSNIALKESKRALQADHVSLFLFDQDSKRLVLSKALGLSKDEADNIKLLAGWEVVRDYLVTKKKPFLVNHVHKNVIFKEKRLPFSSEALPIHSFLAVPLIEDKQIMGALIVSNSRRSTRLFTSNDSKLLVALSNYIAVALMNARLYQRLKDLFLSTVKSLVRAVDAKDRYTSGHSERVMKYAVCIGGQLKLDQDNMEKLRLSSLLHDIGKIGVNENVLSKPGKLSEEERTEVNRHPSIGVKIVESIADAQKIIHGILEHHEHYDGKGYPGGLKGSEISLEGRIIAVADTFDAITTDRPYQKPYTTRQALVRIRRASGTQFDPKIVKAFIASYSKHPEVWRSKNGAGAVVDI